MSELEFDYNKEYLKFVDENNLVDYKNEKLKKPIYHVYEIKNQKYDEESKGYYGGQLYIKGFTITPPKPIRLTQCRSCFKKLIGNQPSQYCSRACKQNGKELRNKKEEFLKKYPNFRAFVWSEDSKSEYWEIEWKDVKGLFENNGKIEFKTDVITSKRHRGKSRHIKNESNDFSKGIDY